MATPVDFPKYLQFLVEDYKEKQQHLFYTLTDLQVEVRVEMPPQEKSQLPAENKPETKIDRLEVLAGLRKYVQQGNHSGIRKKVYLCARRTTGIQYY